MADFLPPGSTIGILGGGQLGRMLALAAAAYGMKALVYDPDPACPAAAVSGHICAGFDDESALADFCRRADVITYEFENIPLEAARFVAAHNVLRPAARALEVCADRLAEKRFLVSLDLPCAPFARFDGEVPAAIGWPAIIKTRRFGYDGKGQIPVADAAAAQKAYAGLRREAIIEKRIDFSGEAALVGARFAGGAFIAYSLTATEHKDGILRRARAGGFLAALEDEAKRATEKIAAALDYTGVLAVEFFITGSGLLINEIAPRVHNTGHWTLDACPVSQFAQHIRAISNWPAGEVQRFADAEMENLIGGDIDDWRGAASGGGALHLYGKAQTRTGRKMGHITRLYPLGFLDSLDGG